MSDHDFFSAHSFLVADDLRNRRGIGEKEILMVSVGTSFFDSLISDIGGIEDAVAAAYPDWTVRRAFTSRTIISRIQARTGLRIDDVDEALERARKSGVKHLIVQPTHLLCGAEYEELIRAERMHRNQFAALLTGEPLFGNMDSDAMASGEVCAAIAQAVAEAASKDGGYASHTAAAEAGVAFVFLGHGALRTTKRDGFYDRLQARMRASGYENVFIGTVRGEPEETSCGAVIRAVQRAGYTKVILRPLMLTAGYHARNDLAGTGGSWLCMFQAAGFAGVDAQISGLGSLSAVQQMYVSHIARVMERMA